MDYGQMSIDMHLESKGKVAVKSKIKLETQLDLSLAYSPGVAGPSMEIARDKENAYKMTNKGNMVAVVSDGSAVLGLGNIGGDAAMPVMEGKAILFRELAAVDAWPICITTQDPDEIIMIVRNLVPTFGGINLEDISAPRCFYIEEQLMDIGIPVFHDDQHGTAVVTLAAVTNALRVVDKDFKDIKVVFSGAGASGIACAKILQGSGVTDMILVDTKGTIWEGREGLNEAKQQIAKTTNREMVKGSVHDAIKGADVFIGLSVKDLLNEDDVRAMNSDAVVLAMANPDPEIMPDVALRAGARVVGTGRSDLPNQVNNVLGFPGIFRGALDARATRVTESMKIAAATAIADVIPEPTADNIIPYPLNPKVVPVVAEAVGKAWRDENPS